MEMEMDEGGLVKQCPKCTFANDHGAVLCVMCDHSSPRNASKRAGFNSADSVAAPNPADFIFEVTCSRHSASHIIRTTRCSRATMFTLFCVGSVCAQVHTWL